MDASAPVGRSAAIAVTGHQLEGRAMLSRSLGGILDIMINSSAVEVMSVYSQDRMQLGSLVPSSNINSGR